MRILPDISRSFDEYLLLPNLTDKNCTPNNVDLSTPLVRHPVGEQSPLRIATPLVSAIMGAVSSPQLAIALAQVGGIASLRVKSASADAAARQQFEPAAQRGLSPSA